MPDATRADETSNLLSRGPRQQYHYVYGSSAANGRDDTSIEEAGAQVATDQDSLVGEALVPTDNEQEDMTPLGSEGDFQQLLMTNGKGVQVLGIHSDYESKTNFLWPWKNRALDCIRFRQSQPLLYIITLAGTASLFIFVLILVLLPSHSINLKPESTFNIPFKHVDRSDYGDPVAKFIDKSLFDPSLINRRGRREFIFPFPTGSFWTNLVLPPTADRGISYPAVVYPYAYAWSDTFLLVSYPASHRREEPKMIHDYFFPDLTLSTQEGTIHRHITYFDALSVTLRFTTQSGKWQTYLVQGSPYITVQYENTSPCFQAFSTFAYVGCNGNQAPTRKDNGSRRRRTNEAGFGVCAWEEDSAKTRRTLRGVQFRITSQEGMDWILFSSEPIELVFDLIGRSSVTSIKKFKGVLRLAHIPVSQHGDSDPRLRNNNAQSGASNNSSLSNGLQRLIYHAGVYPIRGDVSWSFRSSDNEPGGGLNPKNILGKSVSSKSRAAPISSASVSASTRIGSITFQFTTETFTPSSSASNSKPLLMLALPHQAQKLPSSLQLGQDQFDLVYRCIKGPMRPTVGRTWTYDEILPTFGLDDFDPSRNDRKGYLNPTVRSIILESLEKDIKLALPTLTENIYGFGKQSARLAQLTHISHMLLRGNSTYFKTPSNSTTVKDKPLNDVNSDAAGVFVDAVRLLRSSLEQFLNSSVSDALLFDENLGGLVSSDGLRDSGSDFGNGRYNDHHFHYGYILYACAVLGNIDREFLRQYKDAIDAIYLDIAHDLNMKAEKSDKLFFPAARHKVWFDGHSFASGMFPFGNGKSQESSSEAVNGYLGAYLWSLAKHNALHAPSIDSSLQTDFSRLLLATELSGAQMYWHMLPPENETDNRSLLPSATVYSPKFSENFMVGNIGMLDAVSSTWFGTSSLYVHMINEMPITSATSLLFDEPYVRKEYKQAIKPLGDVEMAWRGYVVCNQALVDPSGAWAAAQDLDSAALDSGISKTQVLYFTATRKAFDPRAIESTTRTGPKSTESESTNADDPHIAETTDQSCSAHSQCRKMGLEGLCCPSSDKIMLECCA